MKTLFVAFALLLSVASFANEDDNKTLTDKVIDKVSDKASDKAEQVLDNVLNKIFK